MTNEVQRFDILGAPGSGSFVLSFGGSEPTDNLAHHPAAGDVERALQLLSTIGVGNVDVTKDGNWGYVCAFGGALADQDLPSLTVEANNLGGGATIQVSIVTEGVAPIDPEAPPDSGTGFPVPGTLQQFTNWLKEASVPASGAHHKVVVTSDGSRIYLTPST
jgi:hypothetical protein